MSGILYGVGVGPGDPELMTLKAVRLIRENDVIALPGKVPEETVAYKIAVQAVPELENKTLMGIDFPMIRDRELLEEQYRQNALLLEQVLKSGKNVVFLTLGDVTVYSTFCYVQTYVRNDGFGVEFISGIPAFCASAAALKEPLVEREEPLHVYPALYRNGESIEADIRNIKDRNGTYVLMKSGSRIAAIREKLKQADMQAWMLENCGMPDERIYEGAESFPDEAGYYSTVIIKNK